VEECDRAGEVTDCNIILRKRCACWMIKAINTLRICNYYCFSTATMASRRCLNVNSCLPYMLLQLLDYHIRSSHFLYCIYQSFAQLRLIPSNRFGCKLRLSLKYGETDRQTDRKALPVVHPSFFNFVQGIQE